MGGSLDAALAADDSVLDGELGADIGDVLLLGGGGIIEGENPAS